MSLRGMTGTEEEYMPKTKTFILALAAVVAALAVSAADTRAAGPIDRSSIECLSCHDAALAMDSTIITVCPYPGCDHPIGVNYLISSMENPSLKPAHQLDPAVELPGNMIGCTSCHVPYSEQNHTLLSSMRTSDPLIPDPMLSVSNLGSGLCLECHRK